MSHRLILMRHAKSSWDDPGLNDHDRPLNPRGRRAAQGIGGWLASRGYLPDLILCSSAMRTRETAALVTDELPQKPDLRLDERLYHANPATMLAVLRHAAGDTVMLVGHNPGCAQMAGDLAADPPLHPRFDLYPTAATTIYEFDIDGWDQAEWGHGQVLEFIIPRELGLD